jgi:hypothetical protein
MPRLAVSAQGAYLELTQCQCDVLTRGVEHVQRPLGYGGPLWSEVRLPEPAGFRRQRTIALVVQADRTVGCCGGVEADLPGHGSPIDDVAEPVKVASAARPTGPHRGPAHSSGSSPSLVESQPRRPWTDRLLPMGLWSSHGLARWRRLVGRRAGMSRSSAQTTSCRARCRRWRP